MRIGLLLSVLLLWAQTLLAQATVAAAAKDSLDIFKEGAPASVLEAYNALWNDATHKSFWNEFQQKFAADFDTKNNTNYSFLKTSTFEKLTFSTNVASSKSF